MSEYSLRNCCMALDSFQEKPSWGRNEQVCQGRKRVKRFERCNGLDTALYKNILFMISSILHPAK